MTVGRITNLSKKESIYSKYSPSALYGFVYFGSPFRVIYSLLPAARSANSLSDAD